MDKTKDVIKQESEFHFKLRTRGLAVNSHGVTVSTVDQGGPHSGVQIGKLWLRFPPSTTWWWVGFSSAPLSYKEGYSLENLSPGEIQAKFELT